MYKWFYMWSPKYEIFHHILHHCFQDISGFELRPLYLPQSVFEPKQVLEQGAHYFTGNAIKFRLILSVLQKHPGEHIVFSDADLIVMDPKDLLHSYFKQYEANDMTFMKEGPNTDYLNIGCGFLKSTPEVIAYFEHLKTLVETTNGHDQALLNSELSKFPGKVGSFSLPEVAQSNNVNVASETEHTIIQCLSSLEGYENILIEKLITISLYLDITQFQHLLPPRVINSLIEHAKEYDPISYLTTWEPVPEV